MRAFVRGLGLEHEKILIQDSFAEPHRGCAVQEDREQVQTKVLSLAIKDLIKRQLQDS